MHKILLGLMLLTNFVLAYEVPIYPPKYPNSSLLGFVNVDTTGNVSIKGLKVGNTLATPTHKKLKITKHNINKLRLKRGGYYVYKTPQRILYDEEDTGVIDTDLTYGGYTTLRLPGLGWGNLYGVDEDTNEILPFFYLRTSEVFTVKVLTEDLAPRNIYFMFIKDDGNIITTRSGLYEAPYLATLTPTSFVFNAQVGKPYSLPVSCLNPNNAIVAYHMFWGDDTEDEAVGNSTHVYEDEGTYTIILMATENGETTYEGYNVTVESAYALFVTKTTYKDYVVHYTIENRGDLASPPMEITILHANGFAKTEITPILSKSSFTFSYSLYDVKPDSSFISVRIGNEVH